MKNLKYLFIVMLFFSSVFAYSGTGEDKSGFHHSGQVRLRGEFTDNTDFSTPNDSMDFIGARIRANLGFKAHHFKVLIQPQFTKLFGSSNFFALTAAGMPIPIGASGGLNDGVLFLHQAYAQVTWELLSLWGGRKEVAYGDHLLIGNVDWDNIGRSFDGFTGRFDFKDVGWVDVILLSIAEGGTLGFTAPNDNTLFGLYLGSSIWIFDAWDVYAFWQANRIAVAGTDKDRFVLGSRVTGTHKRFDYRAEATGELISVHGVPGTVGAFQFDLEGGFGSGLWRIALEFAYASLNYRQMFPTGHKWLGHQDLFSRRNIIDVVLHLMYQHPCNIATFYLDVHQFYKPSNAGPAFTFGGAGYGTVGTSQWIGVEFDGYVKVKVHDYLKLRAGASLLVPQQYLSDNVGSNHPVFFYLQGTSNFK